MSTLVTRIRRSDGNLSSFWRLRILHNVKQSTKAAPEHRVTRVSSQTSSTQQQRPVQNGEAWRVLLRAVPKTAESSRSPAPRDLCRGQETVEDRHCEPRGVVPYTVFQRSVLVEAEYLTQRHRNNCRLPKTSQPGDRSQSTVKRTRNTTWGNKRSKSEATGDGEVDPLKALEHHLPED